MTKSTTRVLQTVLPVSALLGSALAVFSSSRPPFSATDKAYYADSATVNFVRPGLAVSILGTTIAADGTVRTSLRLADPRGLPLDREGVVTPGAVALNFVLARIKKGDRQYTAYTTRMQPNPTTGQRFLQATRDSGGTYSKLADGDYAYTFGTRILAADYDATATHTVGIYATRDLTEFGLGTYVANAVFDFVPAGGPVTVVRDIVRTENCNTTCHDPLGAHTGGARREVRLCVLCHTPQTTDHVTGNPVDMKIMIHKIHRGKDLPSVKSGTPYIVEDADFSEVGFPRDIRNCEVCHDKGTQSRNYLTVPARGPCGACHDHVNFVTGENHAGIAQLSDNQCANCHPPQGQVEFDDSVRGSHTIDRFSTMLAGVKLRILEVHNARPGENPVVVFLVEDKAERPLVASQMGRLSLLLAGPTSDYSFVVTEDVRQAAGNGFGVYWWAFQNPIPANAKGSFSVSIEGYRDVRLLEGTAKARTVRDAGQNNVFYFSVDGSRLAPRRAVVATEKCNACHLSLSLHGDIRNRVEHCVQCHHPARTDAARRPASDMPAQTIAFKTMIHRIHTGADSTAEYSVYGFGEKFDFTKVRFPGDRRNCDKCHVNGSQQLPLRDDLLSVVNPRGLLNPMGPVAAACLGCHTSRAAAAHASSMTTPIGEACAACHGPDADFAVNRVHAR